MNANTNKIESPEVMAAGGEIIKLSADEQKVAYGFLLGLLARDSALSACQIEEAS